MKVCPKCNTVYKDEYIVCTKDGIKLEFLSNESIDLEKTQLGPQYVKDTINEKEIDPYIGKTIGGLYRIEKKLGEGGMGVVYVVEHINLNKKFAMKLVSKQVADNPEVIARLRHEAIATSKIEHDNIVNVINLDQTPEGDLYIIMELLKGEPLSNIIQKEGRLHPKRVIEIAIQVCKALEAAHKLGIVHRDLKPENIFIIDKEGKEFVKILDFGISLLKSKETEAVRLTKTGQILGTPLYMSPEQAQGRTDIDHKTDIYSLGIIIYEMLTGSPPFTGDNYFQLLWQHVNAEPPPLGTKGIEVPNLLEKAVMKAIEKNKEDRFSSMEEFREALLEVYTRYYEKGEEKFEVERKRKKALIYFYIGIGLLTFVVVPLSLIFFLKGNNHIKKNEKTASNLTLKVKDERVPKKIDSSPSIEPSIETKDLTFYITIESTPPKVMVFEGEKFLGETPLNYKINSNKGEITLAFKKKGFLTKVIKFNTKEIKNGERLYIELEKEKNLYEKRPIKEDVITKLKIKTHL